MKIDENLFMSSVDLSMQPQFFDCLKYKVMPSKTTKVKTLKPSLCLLMFLYWRVILSSVLRDCIVLLSLFFFFFLTMPCFTRHLIKNDQKTPNNMKHKKYRLSWPQVSFACKKAEIFWYSKIHWCSDGCCLWILLKSCVHQIKICFYCYAFSICLNWLLLFLFILFTLPFFFL